MGNIRSQQVSHSKAATDQAEVNKGAAQSSNSVPELRQVTADNASAIQLNTLAIQRLETLVADLMREIRGTSSSSSAL